MSTSNQNTKISVSRTFVAMEKGEATSETLEWKDLKDNSVIVVLGDSGMGKTTFLQMQADPDLNAEYVKVRLFCRSDVEQYRGKTLYLDGLDEYRTISNSGDLAVDEVVKRLLSLKGQKIRIACRAADWKGDLDTEVLKDVSLGDDVKVVKLAPLVREDVIQIASSFGLLGEEFYRKAQDQDLETFVENPLNLKMLAQEVAKTGEWPRTRAELYDRVCRRMVREENQAHPTKGSDRALLDTAGNLMAVYLLADLEGIALNPGNPEGVWTYVGDIAPNTALAKAAIGTRLFTVSSRENVFEPVHKSFAEYLAARHLSYVVRDGLPFGRVLSLIQGFDGGIPAPLRGLTGWLTCMLPEHAQCIFNRDPLGIIAYGDASLLTLDLKREWFDAIRQACAWEGFPSEWVDDECFASLVDPDLLGNFKSFLENPDEPWFLHRVVLWALAHGQPQPAIAPVLEKYIRSNIFDGYNRRVALEALIHCAPENIIVLKTLFDDVCSGEIADKNLDLRGILLSSLYPKHLTGREVTGCLTNLSLNYIGWYWKFFRHGLVNKTTNDNLPELLDALAVRKLALELKYDSEIEPLEKLVLHGLEVFGKNEDAQRIKAWLGILQDKYGHSKASKAGKEYIRNWLKKNEDIHLEIWETGLNISTLESFRRSYIKVEYLTHHAKPPPNLGFWLLKSAVDQDDDMLAGELVIEAIDILFKTLKYEMALENIESIKNKHPRFIKFVDSSLSREIPDYLKEEWEMGKARIQKEKSQRKQLLKKFEARKEAIRAGQDIGALEYLALIYIGRHLDADGDSPFERITNKFSPEWVDISYEGFLSLQARDDLPSPDDIGKIACEGKEWNVQYPYLVAMDILADKGSEQLIELPPSSIKRAVAFATRGGFDQYKGWMEIFVKTHPGQVVEALNEVWTPQLEAKKETIREVDQLYFKEWMQPISRLMTLDLLKRYPAMPKELERNLIKAALRDGSQDELLDLCKERLAIGEGDGNQIWLAVAFPLDWPTWSERFSNFFSSPEMIEWLAEFIKRLDEMPTIPLGAKAILIRILGSISDPRWESGEDGLGKWCGPLDWARDQVEKFLAEIEKVPDESATKLLHELHEDQGIKKWHRRIAYAIEKNTEIRRRKEYKPPTAEQVLLTLSGGPPTNQADFFSLIVDHLKDLADDIENGPDNLHHLFWGDGRTKQNPYTENTCRDRITTLIKHRLRPLGIGISREDNYRDDKRTDIEFSYRGMKIPLEAKRHYHPKLWTSIGEQLVAFYARDPATEGFGIYLVFWFGVKRGRGIPKLPADIERPTSAKELAVELRKTIPKGCEEKIEVIAIDLT